MRSFCQQNRSTLHGIVFGRSQRRYQCFSQCLSLTSHKRNHLRRRSRYPTQCSRNLEDKQRRLTNQLRSTNHLRKGILFQRSCSRTRLDRPCRRRHSCQSTSRKDKERELACYHPDNSCRQGMECKQRLCWAHSSISSIQPHSR